MNYTRTTIHKRLSTFVDWIAPDQEKERELRAQANRIRECVRSQASDDGLVVRSTPSAGSLAKRTGIRRHKPGGSDVDGFDVDVPFVIAPQTREQEELNELLIRFEGYARACYPQNEIKRTKSSVYIWFQNTRRSYDIVPMLDGDAVEEQILIRSTGERIRTSVQKHVGFTKTRNGNSNAAAGRVTFNQCVRLVKWWRCFREPDSFLHVPSIIVDLLCAHLFDQLGVKTTYEATLAQWFTEGARLVRRRSRVAFDDFTRPPRADPHARWEVLDPVNPNNNVVGSWSSMQIDELADWLEEARDTLNRAITADTLGDDHASKRHLVELFGSPFKHHSGE